LAGGALSLQGPVPPRARQLRRRVALESLGCGATSDAAALIVLSSGDQQHASVIQLAGPGFVPAIRVRLHGRSRSKSS